VGHARWTPDGRWTLPLLLIAMPVALALAGCAADSIRASSSWGRSTERPAWRQEAPAALDPPARLPAREDLDRA
jgi:hypothetical protein